MLVLVATDVPFTYSVATPVFEMVTLRYCQVSTLITPGATSTVGVPPFQISSLRLLVVPSRVRSILSLNAPLPKSKYRE